MVAAARCEPVARTTRRVNPIDRKALVVNIQLNTMNTNTQRNMANRILFWFLGAWSLVGWWKTTGATLVRLARSYYLLLHPREQPG